MSISSRTPEGSPSHCAVCGAATPIEFSIETGDAPCPQCGCLLWKSAAMFDVLAQWLRTHTDMEVHRLSGATHLREIDVDSITLVECIMQLEEAHDISIADEQAAEMQTVGDVIRYLLNHPPQE